MAAGPDGATGKPVTVLIVEDEPLVRPLCPEAHSSKLPSPMEEIMNVRHPHASV